MSAFDLEPRGGPVPRSDQLPAVAGEVAAAVKRAWGRGPARTSAHWAGPDALLVTMEDGRTAPERTLRAHGHDDEVLRARRALQEVLEPDLEATVEDITGRPVQATLSATRLDPDVSAEVFLLGKPRPVITRAEKAMDRAQGLTSESAALVAQTRQIRGRRAARRAAGSQPSGGSPDERNSG